MTTEEQLRHWGISAEADGEDVILSMKDQAGGEAMISLSPLQARRFAHRLCGAYYKADSEQVNRYRLDDHDQLVARREPVAA